MTDTVIITRTIQLHPSQQMKAVLDRNMDYRRRCWNDALELWNDMYAVRALMLSKETRLMIAEYQQIKKTLERNAKLKPATKQQKIQRLHQLATTLTDNDWELAKSNPAPTWRRVRDELVRDKMQWQTQYSARILQLAVQDLGKAFSNFFNQVQPDWGQPKFHSRFEIHQGFKTDTARIKGNRLFLDHPRHNHDQWSSLALNPQDILSDKFGVMSFYRERGKYFVAIPFKVAIERLTKFPSTNRTTGVDLNVDRFVTLDNTLNVTPKRLTRLYKRIKHYQRMLAKKRIVNGQRKSRRSHNYQQTRAKLQRTYHKIHNIQTDLMQQFSTNLIKQYDAIVIEDLNVKGMQMSHIASKGLHRSMFGLFRRLLTYKCQWYQRNLILANRFYPSTQRCPYCGYIKTGADKVTLHGNDKHGTPHGEYICYNPACSRYLQVQDRDYSAAMALNDLIAHPELNHAYR